MANMFSPAHRLVLATGLPLSGKLAPLVRAVRLGVRSADLQGRGRR